MSEAFQEYKEEVRKEIFKYLDMDMFWVEDMFQDDLSVKDAALSVVNGILDLMKGNTI